MTAGGFTPSVEPTGPDGSDLLPRRHRIAPGVTDAQLTKRAILLRAFLEGEKLTRMEAWQRFGDGCANTTVSSLQRLHGLRIERSTVVVLGRANRTCRVARYYLSPRQRGAGLAAFVEELRRSGLVRDADALLAILSGRSSESDS